MQAQQGRVGGGLWLAAGLAVAAVVHGFFNILVFTVSPVGLLLVLLLMGLGLWWILNRLRWSQRISPFRFRRNYPQAECPGCGRRIFITSRYCQACGRSVPASRLPALICSNCGNSVRPDAGYCTRCGDRLLRR
jgi:rRNA maturation endonuclease Nob1